MDIDSISIHKLAI